jgi:hypothetical protein
MLAKPSTVYPALLRNPAHPNTTNQLNPPQPPTAHHQGAHRCMGACLPAHGADCWECFDPDDDKPDGKSAFVGCSYALDLGNARWVVF